MRSFSFKVAMLGVLPLAFASIVLAQDFHKSYRLAAGGAIDIQNVSGDIVITGYDGSSIEVKGVREGRDRDKVEVEDSSTSDQVALKVRYPAHCDCDASIRFQVQVPRSTTFRFERLSSASGDIEVRGVKGDLKTNSASGDVQVSDVTGDVEASSASGEVRVKLVRGVVNAHSASGDVEVEITKLEGATSRMKLTTASGDLVVRLPSDPDVDVEMSTVSGDMSTDFPISIQTPEFGPGHSARGRLGKGSYRLELSTASGDISLKRL